jgi:hypothetical protein
MVVRVMKMFGKNNFLNFNLLIVAAGLLIVFSYTGLFNDLTIFSDSDSDVIENLDDVFSLNYKFNLQKHHFDTIFFESKYIFLSCLIFLSFLILTSINPKEISLLLYRIIRAPPASF